MTTERGHGDVDAVDDDFDDESDQFDDRCENCGDKAWIDYCPECHRVDD